MNQRVQKQQVNIFSIIGISLILLLNTSGTIAWVYLYITGIRAEWWALGCIVLCGIAALVAATKLYQELRKLFF